MHNTQVNFHDDLILSSKGGFILLRGNMPLVTGAGIRVLNNCKLCHICAMEKLTSEEIAEIAEKGRLLFLSAKAKLEPEDYAAYYVYRHQNDSTHSEAADVVKFTIESDSLKNEVIQQSYSSRVTVTSSSSKGKYVRKRTLVEAPPIHTYDMNKWTASLERWLTEKIENLNKDYILYEIMTCIRSEIDIESRPPERFSEHVHNLICQLFWASKRIPRQKGTVHTQSMDDMETKRKEASRKELISLLNESVMFFDKSSPTSTISYRERISYLVNLIIKCIFFGCYPIIRLDELILKEIKEAHKNSSAAYRRFTNSVSRSHRKNR